METPKGLRGDALQLWTDTVAKYELEIQELLALEHACRERMLIERMQKDIDGLAGLTVLGSMDQPVISDLVKEIRQHRAAYTSIIRSLNLPPDSEASAVRSVQAREAAKARWRVVK